MERSRKPGATATSPEQDRQLRQQQEQAFDRLEKLAERNADKSPGEVLAAVTQEVEAARQERHAQRKSPKARRR